MISSLCQAEWLLDEKNSSLNFLTTKNSHITETSSFTHLSGELSEKGKATLHIDLNSINTRIPLRDERIRKILLNTEKYPNAEIQVNVDNKQLQNLLVGQSLQQNIAASLNLQGKTINIEANVSIFRDENGAIHVTTTAPVLLDMVALALDQGVEQLRELAKLNNISYMVPVTFNLIYNPLPV
ncbi:MAG: YceI family protein [Oceanospirillaceae bacterium]|nr:YceI family protein [Oceanospirillaceae bacterium]MCP5335299.1 YceI family protein [Oceanospirillaceae bacterium]MCP5350748.1 YceI family protein [Oceanospirillaceae bacterium]